MSESAKPREPQVAVAPLNTLNTLDAKDVGRGAAEFDAWLQSVSGGVVTLERIKSVAGALPVVGNIMTLVDALGDIVTLVKSKQRDALDWVSLRNAPIRLHRQPDWSGRSYDIDQDPLWQEAKKPQPLDAIAWYQCDHLGTPMELTDHNGEVAWSAQYKAWGEVKQERSAWAKQVGLSNPIRFQGQYHDHETGLHYNRYRYYDPEVGRFIGQDPIKYLGGENLFAYAPNPIFWIDPLGLAKKQPVREVNGCPIIGTGQKTGGDGHAQISEDIADQMAMSGDYERVGVNVAVKTVTGVPTDPITRPDVTGLRKDGKVDIVEVPSPTDKLPVLEAKGRTTLAALGKREGTYLATPQTLRRK